VVSLRRIVSTFFPAHAFGERYDLPIPLLRRTVLARGVPLRYPRWLGWWPAAGFGATRSGS
jgi:hypothetical protein